MTARLKTARLSDSSAVNTIDNAMTALEASLAELLGINLDQDYTGSVNLGGQGGEMDFAVIASSAQLSNFSGETVFSKTRTLTAAALNTVGAVCRMHINGSYTDLKVGDLDNFLIVVKVGSTYIFASSRVASHVQQYGDTNGRWEIELELTTRSTGASGVVQTGGRLCSGADIGGFGFSLNSQLTATLDLTSALQFKVYAWCTSADALKTAKMNGWTIEILQAANTA